MNFALRDSLALPEMEQQAFWANGTERAVAAVRGGAASHVRPQGASEVPSPNCCDRPYLPSCLYTRALGPQT